MKNFFKKLFLKKRKKFYVRKVASTAKLPTKSTAGSACWDFYTPAAVYIHPKETVTFSLGVQVAFPEDYALVFFEKSGLAARTTLIKKAGVVDSDYRGVVKAVFYNAGDETVMFTEGEKVIQAMLIHLDEFDVIEATQSLPETVRGSGGFGSTGRF